MSSYGGVELGVQIIGSEIGVKNAFGQAIAAADAWAADTEAASVKAARALELSGLSAKQAAMAYAKLGVAAAAAATSTKDSTLEMQAAAVRFEATMQGLYAKQAATAAAMASAQERAAMKYETALIGSGRAMTTYFTLPLAIAGYAAIKFATDFQASMTRVETYAGASGAEVKRMQAEILNSAGQFPQGPIELSHALYHLESIGIRGARAMEALKAASIAAGAGMADLTDATTALGGALVSGVKGATDAKVAMAGLVTIAGQGNMTMQDLSNALGTGLAVKAHNVGLSMREVGAALDVLVDRGIPARRSATYLGTTFALMSAPSVAASNALADMGVKASDMGKMMLQPNGLLNVLHMLAAGMERVGKARGAADLMAAFGRSRQSTGIVTLIESLNDKTSNYAQKLAAYDEGVAQASKRMALYQTTAQYKMHTALAQVEADFIKLGTGAMPYVATALQSMAHTVDSLVTAFDHLPAPLKTLLGVLAGTLAVGGPIVLGVGLVLRGFRQLGMVFGEAATTARTGAVVVDGALASIGTSAAAATTQVLELNAALAGTTGVIRMTETGLITVGGTPIGTRNQFSPADMQKMGLMTEAEVASSAGMMASMKAGAGTMMARLGPGLMYSMGGQLVGGMVENMWHGTAGHDIGRTVQLTGAGAGIGTMIEPGIGTAIGAGLGAAAGGIMALYDALSGPSVDEQIKTLAQSIQQLGTAAETAHAQAVGLKATLAQLIANQHGLEKQVARDRAAVRRDPNSRMARDQLRADVTQLQYIKSQIKTTGDQITAAIKAQHQAQHQARVDEAKTVQLYRQSLFDIRGSSRDNAPGWGSHTEAQMRGPMAAEFIKEMTASAEKSSIAATTDKWGSAAQRYDEKMARVKYRLAQVAEQMGRMPTKHEIQVIFTTIWNQKNKPITTAQVKNALQNPLLPGLDGMNQAVYDALFNPPSSTTRPTPVPQVAGLSRAQRIQIAFAENKYNRQTINEEIAIDNAKIARLKKQREEGKINNLQYVNAVTAVYQDRQDMMTRLEQLDKKATGDAKGWQTSMKLQVATAQADALAAGSQGLQGPSAEQVRLAQQAKAAAMKAIASNKLSMKQLIDAWGVIGQANATLMAAGGFHTSMALQVAQAKADAVAALHPGSSGPTAEQLKLAHEAKAAAMKAINSHKLTLQGLIDAWGVVAQANATIAQSFQGGARTYYRTSTDAVADSIKGLTAEQEMELREKLAQRDAHRGYRPAGAGAEGFVLPTGTGPHHRRQRQAVRDAVAAAQSSSSGGTSGGSGVYINNASFTISGVEDARKLLAELESITRRRGGQRTGTRR